jgi:DNA-binding response OmpR family regulator
MQGEGMDPKSSVMIVEDNPIHLELYRMIVEQAGFRSVPVLVSYSGMQLPADEAVGAVLLDYRLGPYMSGFDAMLQLKERYPSAPILLLSDLYDLPSEAAPHVHAFVRKGSPEDLLLALRGILNKPI